jgi:hypothetical protein
MKKEIVNNTTGELENIVMVDPNNLPEVPYGFRMEDETGGNIGQRWTGSAWEDPPSVLEYQRKSMSCTKMQGILTLGETKWGEVLSYRNREFIAGENGEPDQPATTWAEKVVIDSAQDWQRTSENIAFFGHLLNYDDLQIDDLFILAKYIVA